MQLPQFIQRALDFFTKAESNMKAAEELATVKARITALEGEVAGHLVVIGARDGSITALQGQLMAAQGQVTAHEATIAGLRGQVTTEQRRANETIAAQGLPADAVPAAETAAVPGQGQESDWNKYNRLLASNPRAAGQFWAGAGAQILASRPKE